MSAGAHREEGTVAVPVTMYTTAFCPYCVQAERLLTAKGVATIARIRVDLDPEQRSHFARMRNQTRRAHRRRDDT